MAFGFGNTVNPQLGATNYSGFLQGALSGAQMRAQGGAAIGQGIASLGQSIGSGIEKYQQNKIILAGQIGDIEAGIERLSGINPNFISSVPPEIQKNLSKLQKDGTLGVKEAAFTNAYLSTAIKSAADEQERTRAEQAARISGLYRQGDGRMPSMVNERSFDPVALEQGRGAYLRDALTQGQLRRLEAETQALETPKTPTPTEAERNARAVVAAQVAAGLPPEQAPALYAQILGGPAAVTQATLQKQERDKQADEAKRVDEQKKEAEALESTRYRIGVATDTVDKAISLSRLGAGGPLQGLPGVRDISAIVPSFVGIPGVVQGGGRSKTLASYLDTLKATLTIETQKELKKLSATGASGFGPLTEKEGQLLASSVANLDASLPEKILRENLEVIRGLLTKMRGSSGETQYLSPQARKYLQQN
jgi:hypothetical protein